MHASLKLGRPFGIPLGINWSALLMGTLAVWMLTGMLSVAAPGYADGTYLTTAVLTIVLYFGALVGHELGHGVVARRNGLRVEGITLWAFGGFARLSDPSPSAAVELRVAAAGPAVSLVAAGVFWLLALGADLVTDARALVAALSWLALINVILAAFNLLPARPLDGGRIMTALLWWRTGDRSRATVTAAKASRVVGWGMAGAGALLLFQGWFLGLWLLLVAWMIMGSSTAERRLEAWRGGLRGLSLRQVMAPPPVVLPGWTAVEAAAADPRLQGQALTVVERFDGTPGAAVPTAMLARLAQRRPGATLADVAVPLPPTAVRGADEPAGAVLDGTVTLPVLVRDVDGRLVGQVGVAELERWSRFRSGQRAAWQPPNPARHPAGV